jgi:hypothetical protein
VGGKRYPFRFEASAALRHPTITTPAITDQRRWFLWTINGMPDAHRKFIGLVAGKTMLLARRDFRRDITDPPSAELESLIEQWADSCHLGRRPVREWWIFDHAVAWLKRRIAEPPPLPPCEEDDEETREYFTLAEDRRSYCSLSSYLPTPVPHEYIFSSYNPSVDVAAEYTKETIAGFRMYLEKHMLDQNAVYRGNGFRPFKAVRDPRHYEWVVSI